MDLFHVPVKSDSYVLSVMRGYGKVLVDRKSLFFPPELFVMSEKQGLLVPQYEHQFCCVKR